MDSELIKPTGDDSSISQKHDNMLGATIEVLLHFCEKRSIINRREKCALIGYDNKAKLIFKELYVSDENIKKMCLSELSTGGGTEFKEAFSEAQLLVDEINNKKEYIPIIILLTDGDDFHPEETIEKVEKVSLFILF